MSKTNDVVASLGHGNGSGLPHIEQFCGPWAIREDEFNAVLAAGRELNKRLAARFSLELKAITEPQAVTEPDRLDYATPILEGGIAMIQIVGALSKFGSYFGGGTIRIRERVNMAKRDDRVDGVLIYIDSPGGTVSGTRELADAIADLAAVKPVVVAIEGLGASAAYWIASAATQIFATPTSLIGSIGTLMVVDDYSRMFEDAGVDVYVLKEGEFKGAGVIGTKIEEKHLQEWKRVVTELNTHFLAGVASGRRMSRSAVKSIADGRVHLAADAKALGLIDQIGNVEKALAATQRLVNRQRRTGAAAAADSTVTSETIEMTDDNHRAAENEQAAKDELANAAPAGDAKAENNTTAVGTDAAQSPAPTAEQPATLGELKAQIADSTPEFRERCLEQGLTIQQSVTAWSDVLRARAESMDQELADLRAKERAPGNKEPVGTNNDGAARDGGADPISQWDAKMAELTAYGGPFKMSRQKATLHIAKQNPELHKAYLEAWNDRHKR